LAAHPGLDTTEEVIVNWDALGAFGEIIGALAVLITIIFLARQMSQTSRGQNATAFTMWAQMRIELSNAFAQPDIADIITRGLVDPATLSSDDRRLVFHNHLHHFMTLWEVTHRLWCRRLLDDADWSQGRRMIAELKSAPVFTIWWTSVKDYYHPDFVAVVDTLEGVPSGYDNFARKLDSTFAHAGGSR
jgi:hypothetical protein